MSGSGVAFSISFKELRSAGISDACVGPPRALTFIEVFASPFALTLFTALWR